MVPSLKPLNLNVLMVPCVFCYDLTIYSHGNFTSLWLSVLYCSQITQMKYPSVYSLHVFRYAYHNFQYKIILPFENFQVHSLLHFHQFNPFSSHSSPPPKFSISLEDIIFTEVGDLNHHWLSLISSQASTQLYSQPVYCQYIVNILSISHK